MSNFKLIKTAAALALGASVVTSAVVPTDASAASKYKIKNGKLVIAKTGKVAKGYVTYKSTVYKNGKKLTGLKGKTYYKAGKKATGTYKGAYYYKGAKKVTTGTYKGAYYVKGVKKVTTGLYNGRYYKSGAKATGTYKGAYYVKGTKKVTTGTYNGAYYVKGFKKVTTGLYKEEFYQDGKLSKGYAVYNSILYKDAVHNVGLTVFEGKLYDGVSVNKGTEVFEGKLYKGAVLSTGFVKHDDKFYNNGELANGEIDGVEYKDGVVVKYEVLSVKTINASELTVKFSAPVDQESAEEIANYELKVNDVTVKPNNAKLSEDGTTLTIRLNEAEAFKSGDKYVIQTTNDIKNAKGKKLEKFVSPEQMFTETAAPALVSVGNYDAKHLILTFDRPVSTKDASDITLAKIDGTAVSSKELVPVNNRAGSYQYKLEIQAELQVEASKVGAHEVIIYDVKDTTSAYAAKAGVVKGSYTITSEAGIPEVKETYAVNANKFFVETSQAVKLTAASKVVVTKGTHQFTNIDANFDDSLTSTSTQVDATPGYWYNAAGQTITGVWVVVTDANKTTNESNPLYKNGETSVSLNVTLENYVAEVGNKLGAKSTKSVTLNKNNTKPSIDKEKNVFAAGNLAVKFHNQLVTVAGTAVATFADGDVIVRDKDGVIVPGSATVATTDNSIVNIAGTFDSAKAPYSVEFKKDKFRNKEINDSVKSYVVNTLKNDELTTTVGTKSVNFEYAQFQLKKDVTATGTVSDAGDYKVNSEKGEITFKYAVEMDESARNVSNYTLDGEALPTGTKVDFVGDKQTVRITLPEGSLSKSTSYKFGIKTSVTTKEGSKIVSSLQTKAPVELVIKLKDTVSPELISGGKYLVGVETIKPDTTSNKLELLFNEAIKVSELTKAKNDLKVVINGSEQEIESVELVTAGEDKEKKLVITLKHAVNVNQTATITAIAEEAQVGDQEMAIKDASDNKLKAGTSTTVSASKLNALLAAELEKAEAAALAKAITEAKATIETEFPAADYVASKVAYDAQVKTITDATSITDVATKLAAAKTEIAKIKTDQQLVDAEAAKISAQTVSGAANDVKLPTITGYTVTVKSSSDVAVYALDGKILTTGKSSVVYTITNNVTSKSADSKTVAVDVTVTP